MAVVSGKCVAFGVEDAVVSCDGRGNETPVGNRKALVQSELADAVHETWEVGVWRGILVIVEVLSEECCGKIVPPPTAAHCGRYVGRKKLHGGMG